MKKRTKIIIGILLVIFLVTAYVFNLWNLAFNKMLNNYMTEPQEVSLIQLIAHPRKYDGRFVRVEGVGSLEFEDTALYLSKYDYEYIVGKNSVWLELYVEEDGDISDIVDPDAQDGEYVLVEGIFNMWNNGHYDMHAGAIEKVTRYEGGWSRDE
ncbi:MAG: hypothetical protein J1F63_07110 [Oscillospiraceae bacterium]|nr:hypothetical protein [Oscillospiraceae bacterium]